MCYNNNIFKREGEKYGTNDDNIYTNIYNICVNCIFSIAIKVSRFKCKRLLELYTSKPNVRQTICIFKKI